MRYLNFSILATFFALSSSVYAAPPGPDITVSIPEDENTHNRQAFINGLMNLADSEMKHMGKLMIDDTKYDPNLIQQYYITDGGHTYDKSDYWGRDALVHVLLEYMPDSPNLDEQSGTPGTSTQPGLIGGLWSMIWPKATTSDASRSLEQKIDDYHALAKLLSSKYLSWIKQVALHFDQLDVRSTSAPTLKLIKDFKLSAQNLVSVFESEEDNIQHAARVLKNGSKLGSLKLIKNIMGNHQKFVKSILDDITKLIHVYLATDHYHLIKLKPILVDWFKLHNTMGTKADALIQEMESTSR
ncbi:hypothetical protein O5D80_001574 [Batrachochytrium dendrobatidis]|nr:hypothetical protein O5D80_001574 [Batrachochytrium dendrobatidis]